MSTHENESEHLYGDHLNESFNDDANQFNASVGHAMPAAMPYMSLGMIASTVESYNGESNPRYYFDAISRRKNLDRWTDEVTLNIIKYRLRGAALKFFKSDPELDQANYENFQERIIKQFSKLQIPGEAISQLQRCYQKHDEPVSKFTTRIKSLGLKVLAEDLKSATQLEIPGIRSKSKQIILNQFKLGLKKELLKEIGVTLMRTENLTIDEAEEIAKCQEINESLIKMRINSVNVTQINSREDNRTHNYDDPPYQNRNYHYQHQPKFNQPRNYGNNGRNFSYQNESYSNRNHQTSNFNQNPINVFNQRNFQQNRPNNNNYRNHSSTQNPPTNYNNTPPGNHAYNNYQGRNQNYGNNNYESSSRNFNDQPNNYTRNFNNYSNNLGTANRINENNYNYRPNRPNYNNYNSRINQPSSNNPTNSQPNSPFNSSNNNSTGSNANGNLRDQLPLNSQPATIAPQIVAQAPSNQ